MDTKILLIGLVIGLIMGTGVGYAAVSPQLSSLQAQATLFETNANKVPGLEAQVSQLTSDKNSLQGEVTTLQGQLATKTGEMNKLNSQITNLQTQVSTLQKTVADLQKLLPPAPPSEGQPGSSRFSPATIGTPLTMNYVRGSSGTYTAIITVLQVIRGDAAWSQIYAANPYNDPAPSGYEYILVKVRYNYVNGPTVNTLEKLDEFTFQAFSGSGTKYDIPAIVEPDPKFDVDLYPGNTFEGWATYKVLKTDAKPMLSFAVSLDGSGGIWFKL